MADAMHELLAALDEHSAQHRIMVSAVVSLFMTHPDPLKLLQAFRAETERDAAQLLASGHSDSALESASQLREALTSLLQKPPAAGN